MKEPILLISDALNESYLLQFKTLLEKQLKNRSVIVRSYQSAMLASLAGKERIIIYDIKHPHEKYLQNIKLGGRVFLTSESMLDLDKQAMYGAGVEGRDFFKLTNGIEGMIYRDSSSQLFAITHSNNSTTLYDIIEQKINVFS